MVRVMQVTVNWITPSLQEYFDDNQPQEQHEDDQNHLYQVQCRSMLDRRVSIRDY
jgi:hypothetical protein